MRLFSRVVLHPGVTLRVDDDDVRGAQPQRERSGRRDVTVFAPPGRAAVAVSVADAFAAAGDK